MTGAFPVGAKVLIDGRDKAIIRSAFPTGSLSFTFPHYRVDIAEGDRNVVVAMSRVGITAAVAVTVHLADPQWALLETCDGDPKGVAVAPAGPSATRFWRMHRDLASLGFTRRNDGRSIQITDEGRAALALRNDERTRRTPALVPIDGGTRRGAR